MKCKPSKGRHHQQRWTSSWYKQTCVEFEMLFQTAEEGSFVSIVQKGHWTKTKYLFPKTNLRGSLLNVCLPATHTAPPNVVLKGLYTIDKWSINCIHTLWDWSDMYRNQPVKVSAHFVESSQEHCSNTFGFVCVHFNVGETDRSRDWFQSCNTLPVF